MAEDHEVIRMKFMIRRRIFIFTFFFGLLLSPDLFAQETGQQFQGFNLEGYTDGGQKAWEVKGTKADVMDNSIKITNVDANQFGEQKMNLKAKEGTIDKASGDMHVENNVVITSDRGSQLKTDSLDWKKTQDLVTTNDRVHIIDRALEATGTGLSAQPGLKTAQMQKDVTVKVNTEPDKPNGDVVVVTSDGPMEMDQKKNLAVFNKNVVAVQNDRTLKADRMEIYFDQQSQRIKQLVCIGNVYIIQGQNTSQSEKAVYDAAEEKLTLLGRPKLIMVTQGNDGLASLNTKDKKDEKKEKK